MNIPESDYQILKLTEEFYNSYPDPPYTELMKKDKRAYTCLLFQSHYGYFICVPFRTEINHKYAFHFKKSLRSRMHKSGLDYTKIAIITKGEYIETKDAVIDRDEFRETISNIKRIKREVLRFVEDYIEHNKGIKVLHAKEYRRRYAYTSLKYFHKELGI